MELSIGSVVRAMLGDIQIGMKKANKMSREDRVEAEKVWKRFE